MPLPSEWTLVQTKQLRRLSPDEAEELMNSYGLPESARQTLRSMLQPSQRDDEAKPISRHPWRAPSPDRPLWLAVAWLLGASHSTLARIHGVSTQAIQQSINKTMPDVEARHTQRLGYRLGIEATEAYQRAYHDNIHNLRGLPPIEAAHWLQAETAIDV